MYKHKRNVELQGVEAHHPQIFFLPKWFYGYWVEERKIKKYKYFLNGYLGGVKREKRKTCILREVEMGHPSHSYTKEDRHYILCVLFA
jgi:hypothetical protein